MKTFEGHRSWVLCINTLPFKKLDGTISKEYLFTGSDDNFIKIWDMKTTHCLEELNGHTNSVICMTFANNHLYSGSYDHCMIVWDLAKVEAKILEN